METVVIRHTLSDEPLSLNKYREALRSRRTSYRPSLFELTLPRIYPDIQDSVAKARLLDFIREELAEYIHKDNMHTATFSGDAFPGHDPLEQLLWNLLRNTIAWDVERTVRDFGRCVEASCGSFLRIALLRGASVEHEVQLYDGVQFVPLPSSSSDFPTFMPDPTMFGVTERAFTSETVVVMDYTVTPLFCKPARDGTDQFQEAPNSKDAPSFDLDRFCQALSLAANSAIRSEFEWEYFDENEISMLSQTGGHRTYWGSPKPSYAFDEYVEVSEAHIHKAKRLYECWDNLDPCVHEALQIPIDRWIRSKTSRDAVNKMIDLGIALESLYLSDNPGQQSFPLRLRAAWHMGENNTERKKLLAEFKEIYKWRSNAVHKGILPKRPRVPGKSISQSDFIERAQCLCLESILRIIRDGHFPNWDDLILGEDGS